MKNLKFKTISLSLYTLFVIGMGLSLTSTTTVENSNTQLLTELASQLNDVNAELAELKAAEKVNAVAADPLLGEVIIFAGNFAPRGWAKCEGQLLPISQNSALFSLLGTAYGGDGRTTFGLPDLRGRVPVGVGSGPGLMPWRWGQRGGAETHTLSVNEMPSHNHQHGKEPTHVMVNDGEDLEAGNTAFLGVRNEVNGDLTSSFQILNTGGSMPHNILQPSLGMHYIIAVQGVFPSRS